MSSTSEARTGQGAEPATAPAGQASPERAPSPLLTVGALAMLMGVLYVLARRGVQPLNNPDTFFHLRFGAEFLSGNWSLRDPGTVSSYATAEWLPTQWLSQVAMAWLEDRFGLAGVTWFAAFMMCTLGLALYLACRQEASPTLAVVASMAAIAASWAGLSARPQVLSYALIAVFTAAWLAYSRDGRVRWWLVPLMWLWPMLHGMWPVGLLLGAAAVLGVLLDRRHGWRTAGAGAVAVALGAVAAAVTPVGPAIYGAVVGVGGRSQFISEWLAPQLIFSVFTPVLVLVLGVLLIRLRTPMTWTEVLFTLSALLWVVYAKRTVPVGAVILAPLAAGSLQTLVPGWSRPSRLERGVVLAGYVVAVAGAAVVLAVSPHRSDPTESEPAAQRLDALPAGTKVLNEWRVGGYLMWRHPQLDLMMHGYADNFEVDQLQRNEDIISVKPGWTELVEESEARIAVLDADGALAEALEREEGWTVTAEDDLVVVLEAPVGWSAG